MNTMAISLKDSLNNWWTKKSLWAKFSDILFIAFIIALMFPEGRMAIGGGVNRVKAMFVEPTIDNNANGETIDYNWGLLDMEGKPFNMEEAKGKVIFVNLWATWCPPCVGEMPGIQKLYNLFKDDPNVEFILASSEPAEKIIPFMKKKGFTFPVYSMMTYPPEEFSSRSIPATFVVNKNGEVKVSKKGAANWGGEKMQNLMHELINE